FTYEEFGYGPAQTAALFTAIVVPSFTGPLWGYVRDRTNSPQLLITAGFCLVVPICVGMAFVQKSPEAGFLLSGVIEAFKKKAVDADAKGMAGVLAGLLVAYGMT